MYAVSDEYMDAARLGVQKSHIRGSIGRINFTERNVRRGSLSIYNQSSGSSDITLGSVYVGVLECTFFGIDIPQWQGQYVTIEAGLEIDDEGTVEYVPAPSGRYRIDKANRTRYGVVVTAYDDMQKLDKSFGITDLSPAQPFELLQFACGQCGVTLGMRSLSGFPNANRTLKLYPDHDIETYRDLVYWIAQTLGGFATIDRNGRLVIRRYSGSVVDTIGSTHRRNDSEFSNFSTKYTGISVVNIEEEKTKYYGAAVDNGTVINLGSNPFMQTNDQESMAREILEEVGHIQYVPFRTSLKAGMQYDLGDVILNQNGLAGNSTCCIMSYEYEYGKGYTLEGYGADPMLATGKSKSDKNIAALMNKVKSEQFTVHSYVNSDDIEINDSASVTIVDIAYGTAKDTTISFYAEIQLNVECVEDTENGIYDAEAVITYQNMGEPFVVRPTNTYLDGKHVLHLIQKFDVDTGQIGVFSVILTAAGGNFEILAGECKAWLEGTGLVTEEQWDGILRLSDFWTAVNLPEDISISNYADAIRYTDYIPVGGAFVETMSDVILLADIEIGTYTDNVEEVFDNE